MIRIRYPEPGFRIKNQDGKDFVFDALRKKWVVLTPEEWVRQNFVQYLVRDKQYPVSYIALEKEIRLGELKKRFDVLIYDREHKPWMMVECKAMDIKLGEDVLQQALRYNISVPVTYLVITNGNDCYAWHNTNGQLQPCTELPEHE